MIFWTGVLIIVGLLAYIRLAPSDPDRWHQPVTADQDKNMKTGAIRVIDAGPGALAQVDAAARELDRTEVLAGSVADGRVTYVTRSRLDGVPGLYHRRTGREHVENVRAPAVWQIRSWRQCCATAATGGCGPVSLTDSRTEPRATSARSATSGIAP